MTSARTSPGRRRFLTTVAAGAAAGALWASGSAQARPEDSARQAGGRGAKAAPRPLYLGTYTSEAGGGTGIGLGSYDPADGSVTLSGTLTGVDNPSFLAVSPSGGHLYAVNEQADGGVTAVAVAEDGSLTVLGTRSTGGQAPCHLSVHPGGRHLLSANYSSGSVAVHPIDENGALGERTDLVEHTSPPPGPGQQGAHAHQILTTPDGGHVLAVDLGTDSVYTYRLDTGAGTLEEVSVASLPAGAGPRALAFHPSGAYAYLANELNNTIAVCAYAPETGEVTPGTPQPTGTAEGVASYPAQPLVTPDGAHVYLSNRGDNSISRFAVGEGGATLTLLDTVPVGGDWPRHIALSPDGGLLFASNQRSDNLTVFTVDPGSGALTEAGSSAAPVPVCALPL
ncbi:lactonase family protein [Streptomyces sp. Ru87]|uniref:lactonase family protein n=1 Tax=Streptomyces sp. Ru87 TaxID=2044307 RepID=UPI000BF7CCB7|nr:lactonase family protein [Streptomyces sp. Ru87]PGH47392.1 6-phosphogluconolactonase [Streptomyces sp. Ru87]